MKTNRFIALLGATLIATTTFGQTIYDALRFSHLNYEGTARSMALGNAFTALGGDLGGIAINPAASGVYNYSEFTFTPSLNGTTDQTTLLGTTNKSHKYNFGMSNLGGVITYKTGREVGLISLNIGVVANKVAHYNSSSHASGRQTETSRLGAIAASLSDSNRMIDCRDLAMPSDNPNAPFNNLNTSWEEVLAWNVMGIDTLGGYNQYIAATENIFPNNTIGLAGPIYQFQHYETSGYNQHFTLNFGGNISHKFYFGVNFTFQNTLYTKLIKYSEASDDVSQFQTQFVDYSHYFNQMVNGTGFNMKLGVIYRPFKGVRIGASIATPTWAKYRNESYEDMESNIYNKRFSAKSPLNVYDYSITSPLRWSIGGAYTLGNVGLISIDYENVNYKYISFKTSTYMSIADLNYYRNLNSEMKQRFGNVHYLRGGIEFKPISRLSLRGGYSFTSKTFSDPSYNDTKHYASLGIGYVTKSAIYFDLGYRQQCNTNKDEYILYPDYIPNSPSPTVTSLCRDWKLLLTVGFRF